MSVDVPAWVKDAVFYQVFPDRLAHSGRVDAPGPFEPWDDPPTSHGFKGGDLYGVVAHLDRLADLGITALYLNPVFMSAANHRYHTDDYFNVDPLLGGNEALRLLLDEAHRRDMRVILDGVFNHVGRGFWPFHHVLENGSQSPYRGWFHLHDDVHAGERSLTAFPSAEQLGLMAEREAGGAARGTISPSVLGYAAWWDLPALPKLNVDEAHVRALLLEVTEHWLQFGIDGWRLDVAEEIGADFWREFRGRARNVNADAYLVAEIWHPMPDWLRGDMFDALMNYPLMAAIVGFVAAGHLDVDERTPDELRAQLRPCHATELAERLTGLHDELPPEVNAVQLNLLGSHDIPRLRALVGGDLTSVQLAMLIQMTLPGAPCIYYGDEIGMVGAMDPDCRRGFPSDPACWNDVPHDWLRGLIAQRRSHRALRDGELHILHASGDLLVYLRRFERETIVIVVNAGATPASADVALAWPVRSIESVALESGPGDPPRAEPGDERLHVRAPGRSGGLLRLAIDA